MCSEGSTTDQSPELDKFITHSHTHTHTHTHTFLSPYKLQRSRNGYKARKLHTAYNTHVHRKSQTYTCRHKPSPRIYTYKRNGTTYWQRRDSVNSFILLAFGFYLLMGSVKRNRFSGTLTQDPVCKHHYYAGYTEAGDRRIQRLPPDGFRSRCGQNIPKGEKCNFICCVVGIITNSE